MTLDRRDDIPREMLGLLALLGQTGGTQGPPPNPAELRILLRQQLSPARRAEIETHLAHDPQVCAAFAALIRQDATRPQAARGFNLSALWKWKGPLPAVCAVAAIGVAIGLHFWQPSSPSNSSRTRVVSQTAQSPSTPPSTSVRRDWRGRAFSYGYQHPGALDRWVSGSAEAFAGNCGEGRCHSELEALIALGVVVAGMEQACRNPDSGYLDAAPRAIMRVQTLRPDIRDSTWSREADRLLQVLRRPAREACTVIEGLGRTAGQ